MMRQLFGTLALAAVASVAGAQTPPATTVDSTSVTQQTQKPATKKRAKRYTTTSRGEVDRGGPGYSLRAIPRDWVRAEDTRGDDLWRREQMLDAKYGKDRERKP